MSDRIKIVRYHHFFKKKYGNQVFSKSRKRKFVFLRRLIVMFLVKEKGLKQCFVAKILIVPHPVIFYYMKPVIDLEFDKYYALNVSELKEDFDLKFPENGSQ